MLKGQQHPNHLETLAAPAFVSALLKTRRNLKTPCAAGATLEQIASAEAAEAGADPPAGTQAAPEGGAADGDAAGGGGARHAMREVCAVVEEARELEVDEGLRFQIRDAALSALAWETTASVLFGVRQYVPVFYAVFHSFPGCMC